MSGIARRVVIALAVALGLGLGLLGFLGASSARAETSTASESTTTATGAATKAAETPKGDPEAPAPKPKPKPEHKPDPKPDPEPEPKASSDDSNPSDATAAEAADDVAAAAVADPTLDPTAPAIGPAAPSPEQAALLPPVVHDHATTAVTGDDTNALAVSVDDHPKAVTPGGTITYDIVLTNVGTAPATGIVWADIVPKDLTDVTVEFVGGSNTTDTDWVCLPLRVTRNLIRVVNCWIQPTASLGSGDWAHFRLTATVDPETPVGSVIRNEVHASWNESPPGSFPLVAVVNTPVVAKAVNASFVVHEVDEGGLPLTGAAGLIWLLFAGLALAGTGSIALGATRRRIAD